MAQSGFIVSLAKSRANILDILQKRGFLTFQIMRGPM